MIKVAIFASGVLCGIALSSKMTDEQRNKVLGKVRSVADSDTAQRLGGAARKATDAVVETAVSTVEDGADKVAEVVAKTDA